MSIREANLRKELYLMPDIIILLTKDISLTNSVLKQIFYLDNLITVCMLPHNLGLVT